MSERQTILVVEDHASAQALFTYKLQVEGFTVLAANNSEEALQIGEQHPESIDLLIADVFLPRTPGLHMLQTAESKQSGINGVELVHQLRVKHPEARVLFISGHSDDLLQALGVFKEQWPLLRKPFNATTLVETARQVLSN